MRKAILYQRKVVEMVKVEIVLGEYLGFSHLDKTPEHFRGKLFFL
jgi:hypothetical protein